MGDRANIVIDQTTYGPGNRVWFYGHYAGTYTPRLLQNGLKLARDNRDGQSRLEDAAYLARIVFDEFTKDSGTETTGFGISTTMTGNERPILVVDVKKQVVKIEDEDGADKREPIPIREYLKLKLVGGEADWHVLLPPRRRDD